MAKWMQGLFSGTPGDMSRVGVWGLLVMLAGLLGVAMAKKTAAKYFREERRETAIMGLKLGGLLLVAVGALGAMKII